MECRLDSLPAHTARLGTLFGGSLYARVRTRSRNGVDRAQGTIDHCQ